MCVAELDLCGWLTWARAGRRVVSARVAEFWVHTTDGLDENPRSVNWNVNIYR